MRIRGGFTVGKLYDAQRLFSILPCYSFAGISLPLIFFQFIPQCKKRVIVLKGKPQPFFRRFRQPDIQLELLMCGGVSSMVISTQKYSNLVCLSSSLHSQVVETAAVLDFWCLLIVQPPSSLVPILISNVIVFEINYYFFKEIKHWYKCTKLFFIDWQW